MAFFRKRKSLWELREGDLPGEEVIRACPALRGLADSAAFRMVVFDRRRGGLLRAISTAGVIVLYATLLLGLALSQPFIWLILISSSVSLFFAAHRLAVHWGLEFMLPIRIEALAELAQTPIKGSEVVKALWGARVARRRARLRMSVAVLVALVSLALLAGPSAWRAFGPHPALLWIGLAAGCGYCVAARHGAYSGLAGVQLDLRFLQEILLKGDPSRAEWKRLEEQSAFTPRLSEEDSKAIGGITIGLLVGIVAAAFAAPLVLEFGLPKFLPMVFWVLLALAVGGVCGRVFEIHARGAAKSRFDALTVQAGLLLGAAESLHGRAERARADRRA